MVTVAMCPSWSLEYVFVFSLTFEEVLEPDDVDELLEEALEPGSVELLEEGVPEVLPLNVKPGDGTLVPPIAPTCCHICELKFGSMEAVWELAPDINAMRSDIT